MAAPLPLAGASGKQPNIVIIFLDDSGWSDFRPFGRPPYPTPNVERLAAEGCAYRQFYVPQAVCSASRAALLTGCFPGRTKVFGAHGPRQRGLDPRFATMGDVLRTAGYRTAVFGKWHIGDQPDTRPPARGFDESCGLMYSNDMWVFHPNGPKAFPFPLQYWENGKVQIEGVTQKEQPFLTQWYTEHAISFIERNKDQPFFLYVPHSMPHVPLFPGAKFAGKSGAGTYGDVMMELDWSVGEILNALDRTGASDNTLVIFTSDNGPWTSYGNHSGSTPFREAKGTGFDGGTRSACILRYPGHIPAGMSSDRTFCTVDLLPTIARLTGAKPPAYPIDGLDVWPWITGQPGSKNPHDYYVFSTNQVLEAVMTGDGRWKLHVPHSYRQVVVPGNNGAAGVYRQEPIGLSLYDLKEDPEESRNVIDSHPELAKRMEQFARKQIDEFYPPKRAAQPAARTPR